MYIILTIILIITTIIAIALGIYAILMVLSILIGVPYIPVKKSEAKKMIELAQIKPGMKVVDLGSGAGRLLFLAANQGALATGYELNPLLTIWTRILILLKGLKGKIEVRRQSIYHADLQDVDIVLAFLMPKPMKKLANKLFSELKPGAKIVSYAFSVPDKEPILKQGKILIYQLSITPISGILKHLQPR